MKPGLTAEETDFLRTLYSAGGSDDAPGDCMECGQQIDSARSIKYRGAILCQKCADKLVEIDLETIKAIR